MNDNVASSSNRHSVSQMLPPCPLDQARPQILDALATASNLVLSALPGAGKSTRVPLWLLEQPWAKNRRILMLEPRRVAARALARYMAALLHDEPGGVVGYRMRDESRTGPRTRIEVVTEGVLTRMLQEDAELPGVACVIFDEFHERSLVADTGLALCLESQAALRPDLRLAVMSATLDEKAVAALMGDCPTLACAGKTFPVDMRHLPPDIRASRISGPAVNGTGLETGQLLWRHMADVIAHLLRTEQGSLLAFLPGAGEIRRVAALLENGLPPDVALCPLYGNLSAREQDAAIEPAPSGCRKVVLATSIAETSLTIEGVRMVVDSGLARLARFDPASGLTRLVTERVSLAGAAQRAGRAGRTEPGVCCRLWAREAENGMRPHIRPEMLDADLSGLVLQLAVWGATDPTALPWLTPPPPAHVAVARQCLQNLGALDAHGRATDTGKRMAALPLSPRTARMLLWGEENGHGPLAACLAALLEERDPLARTGVARQEEGGSPPVVGCDMLQRLDWLCRDERYAGNMSGIRTRLQRLAMRLWQAVLRQTQKQPPARSATPLPRTSAELFATALADAAAAGMLVAVAWPEQVAMNVSENAAGASGTSPARGGKLPMTPFLLRSGRAAQIAENDPLSRQRFLAAAEVDGASPRGRMRLAAALSEHDMESIFSGDITFTDVLRVTDAGMVTARRQRLLGALVLEDAPLPRPQPEECAEALCAFVRERGLSCLPWNEDSSQWRARVELMRQLDGDAWPDVSDAALLETLDLWLAPALTQILSSPQATQGGKAPRVCGLAALGPELLGEALRALLPGHLRRTLKRQAPANWQVPSGAMHPIIYGDDGGPWLAAKLQELFGCVETPRIAEGRVALVLHLNSPAGRPLQVTRDLPHFWRNGYPAVRAEMRGRYPRHPWPEDPFTATATALTKKRLAAQSKN